MSTQSASVPHIVDPYQYVGITINPDGSLTRNMLFPKISPTPDHPTPVLSKDATINQSHNTWARIFLPREALDEASRRKLPVVFYFHGGGFIICDADMNIFHALCSSLAKETKTIVVSVNYRLCPEHRLPAAYEDGADALRWLKNTEEEWIREHADLSNCFLMGTSAGANIVYHVGLRLTGMENDDLVPVKIRGLIFHHAFFGGVKRSGSETRLVDDLVLPPIVTDLMWELSLPVGADRDHEYCNPTVGEGPKHLGNIGRLGWKVCFIGCDKDPLVDRQMEVARMMEEAAVQVVASFSGGGWHGIELFEVDRARDMIVFIRDFILSAKSTGQFRE